MANHGNFFRTINALSIDVAIGAVGCSAFISQLLQRHLSVAAATSLMLTTWTIYTVDHLRDAAKMEAPSTYRHQIHREHAKTLWIAVAIATLINTIAVFFLERSILVSGLIVALFSGIYLLLQRYLSLLKELAIAVIYTAGIFVASNGSAPDLHQHPQIIFFFILTAYTNLATFSWFDRAVDLREGHASVAVTLGRRGVVLVILICFIVATISVVNIGYPAVGVLWLICLLHVAMIPFKSWFERHDRFRIFGDALFLLPGMSVLVHRLINSC
jgi:hypothetical protein